MNRRTFVQAAALVTAAPTISTFAQTPEPEHTQPTIATNAWHLLPQESTDDVSAIVIGQPDGSNRIGFIVRNDTDETVAIHQVKCDVRDAADSLIGVAMANSSSVHPNVMSPGDIAAGWIYLEDIDTAAAGEFTFSVETKAPDRMNAMWPDVVFGDVNNTGKALVGTVSNPSEVEISFVSFTSLLLASDGAIVGMSSDSQMMTIEAGGESTFQASLADGDGEHFVLGGTSM